LYMMATRLDIMYATSLLSQFIHKSSQTPFAQRMLRYIQGTVDFDILYVRNVDAN